MDREHMRRTRSGSRLVEQSEATRARLRRGHTGTQLHAGVEPVRVEVDALLEWAPVDRHADGSDRDAESRSHRRRQERARVGAHHDHRLARFSASSFGSRRRSNRSTRDAITIVVAAFARGRAPVGRGPHRFGSPRLHQTRPAPIQPSAETTTDTRAGRFTRGALPARTATATSSGA